VSGDLPTPACRVPVSDLLTAEAIGEDPATYVRSRGTVVAEFGPLTQDSGNVSWLVDVEDRRLFVKTAGSDALPAPGAPVPYLDHAGRVALLRNAVDVAGSSRHPALPELLNVIESPSGPALVYEAARGDLVGVRREARDDPATPYQRLAHLPADRLLGVFDDLVDVHATLAAAGWVACDLYDGCLIVDFATTSLTVVDLDTYRRGPSVNDMGRMFGAARFMAPEEFELGAVLDQRTTVFTLGRLVWHFATRLTERAEDFCGPDDLAGVVQQACRPAPRDRHSSVEAFAEAWRSARSRP
jgi:serine/threonine-protein kinase